MNGLVGAIIENDLAELRHKKTGRQYFDDFCALLKENKIHYSIDKRAQVVIINDSPFYYLGSNTWWGAQKSVIGNLQNDNKKDKKDKKVYIILFANTHKPHYYVFEAPDCKNDLKERITFSEVNDKLNVNEAEKIVSPDNLIKKIKEKAGINNAVQ